MAYQNPDTGKTEQILKQAVSTIRKNPDKYRGLQKALQEAKSDDDRVRHLVQFATTDRELAALAPSSGAEAALVTVTTVTVTTVFTLEGSAY